MISCKRGCIIVSKYVLARMQIIQKELEELREVLAHQVPGLKCKTKLKGLWKGVRVREEVLKEAQHSLFKGAYEHDE